jgi:DNA-binding phage protein
MKTAERIEQKIKQVRDEMDRARVFLDLLSAIRDSGFTLDALAEEAGVAPATLYFWLNNFTKRPRIDTVCKVAHALGFDVRLQRTRTVKPTASQRKLNVVK